MVQIKFDWSVQLANGYRDPETQSNGSHYSLATHAKPYSVGSGHRTWFKAEIERERDTAPTPCEATERKRQLLLQLKSIGPAISALLSREVYYRQFANRRQVGSFLGLTPSPYSSGEEERCQGISRAGSGQVRAIMVETAWLWIRHQPKSALTRWFVERTAGQSTRMRKIMIVAVARKLAIALWRYVEQGLVPQGAILNPPTTGRAR
jgi:transposase